MEKSQKDKYIEYLTYRFSNKAFWLIVLLSLIVDGIFGILWAKSFMVLYIAIIEFSVIFGLQKLIFKINYCKNRVETQYNSQKVNKSEYSKTILSFKIVDFFIVVSFILWLSIILFPITNVNNTVELVIAQSALISVITVFIIIGSSVYNTAKNN